MRSVLPLFAFAFAVAAPALASEVVPVPAFNGVELRGGGSVVLTRAAVQRVTVIDGSTRFTRLRVDRDGKLKIDACNARCPHRYRLRVIVESPTIPRTLAVKGGGSITASSGYGNQRLVALAVNGGGAIDTRAVRIDTVTAAISGGGDIKVRSRQALTAAVNGGGAVRYWGNPAVTTVINGGGSVLPGS